MEQTIIDFYVKASELILHNRLPNTPPLQTICNTLLSPNPPSFQLYFNQKFNFSSHIPLQWTTQFNKLLVIEFHVCAKSSNTKFLAEQWIFDINQIGNSKANETIDSVQTLYKKLAVLLRTISSLTVTLPLYQKLIGKEKNDNNGSNLYTIEHTINFTRHTLSAWHPTIHEEKDLFSYTSPDLVLPGRIFSFKVNYSKSLSFLNNTLLSNDIPVTARSTHNHQHSYSDSKKPNTSTKHLTLTRRSCSDTYDRGGSKQSLVPINCYDAPPVLELEESNWDSESSRLEKADIVTTLQRPGNFLTSNLALRVTTGLRLFSESATPRPRLNTMDFGLLRRNMDKENRSPSKMALYQMDEDGGGYQAFRKISEDFEQNKLRLCTNPGSIEKILKQNDDDKISELIHSIEELKSLSGGIVSSRHITSHWIMDKVLREDREGRNRQFIKGKGLRFEMMSGSKEGSQRSRSPLEEINELKGLYLEIKRSNSIE